MEEKVLVGAHISIAGGLQLAPMRGKEVGATVMQIFTSNQKQWQGKRITEEELQLWHQALEDTGITHVMSHDSYLINLGSPKPPLLEKSRAAFRQELSRCHLLDIDYLNFHPGAATDSDVEKCLDTIIESLLTIKDLSDKGPTRLLLETTAGQGSTVGHTFEQLAYIIRNVKQHIPIGVCIDTCHTFSAGYDIRTFDACEKTFQQFDDIIGMQHLYAFHINDSLKELGQRKDRHANIGKGFIGEECFKYLMQNSKTKHIPKYLETPNGSEFWKDEISLLKSYATNELSNTL
ncbi:MAG: deoxyribonuclease IV [Chlamydiota bacterium]|jgi:deoxyribonuclease-4